MGVVIVRVPGGSIGTNFGSKAHRVYSRKGMIALYFTFYHRFQFCPIILID